MHLTPTTGVSFHFVTINKIATNQQLDHELNDWSRLHALFRFH